MTVPNAPFRLSEVLTEVGVALPSAVDIAAVRSLVGVPTGDMSMALAAGKSSFRADFTIGAQTNTSAGGTNRRAARVLTSSVVGGVGPFAFAWSLLPGSTYNLLTGTSSANASLSQTYDTALDEEVIEETSAVQLIVTDTANGKTSTITHNVTIS